jgi:CubicO group peptidase (beta-lactamase class C family)
LTTRAPHSSPSRHGPFTFLHVALVAAIAVGLTVAGLADTQPGSALDAGAIERFVGDYQTRLGIPGVAIILTKGKEIVSVAGFGQDSRGQPITSRTMMPIASLSKSFTAMAVMQLVEAGKVQLDRPVREYLPDFALADSRAERITVRQVLDHTSGMADTTFHEKSGPRPESLAGGVALLRTAHLAGDPGSRARYHNPNYWVAARIVEVVSGESFDGYLRHHVFEPIGMPDTRTVGSLRQVPDLAEGHIRMYGYPLALPEPPWFLDGASGVVTTAADFAQWLILQNNGGQAVNGTRIISAAHIGEMHRGLGWGTRSVGGLQETEHSGWLFTFTAHQILLEKTGYGIAVLTNVGLGLSPVDSQQMAQALAEMTTGTTPNRPARTALIVDSVLGGLTLLALALGLRSLVRAQGWGERRARRPAWRTILVLLRGLLPVALLLGLPALLSIVFGGRDGSWLQLLYLAPSLIIWLVVASLAGLAVIVARATQLLRRPR